MGLFLKKFVLYIFLVGFIVIGGILFVELLTANDKHYHIPPDKNIIIMGHSHTECALNDTLIHDAINFSQSAESYFYTFLKLKKLCNVNPQVNTLLLEFTNNNMDVTMDEWIFGDKYLAYRYGQYSQLMQMDDKLFLVKNNPHQFIGAQSPALKKKLLFFTKRSTAFFDYFDWGGYVVGKQKTVDEPIEDVIENTNETGKTKEKPVMSTDVSINNIFYLHQIIDFCKDHNIKLILIRTPLKHDYIRIHEQKIIELSSSDFKDIPFFDFADYSLPDADFYDKEHVNYNGSIKISHIIDSIINKN